MGASDMNLYPSDDGDDYCVKNISLRRVHSCDPDVCSVLIRSRKKNLQIIPNNEYNPNMKKCEKFGRREAWCVYIGKYDPDNWAASELLCPQELVIKSGIIRVVYTYPFERPITMKYVSYNGFTRKMLIDLICKSYLSLYETRMENPFRFGVQEVRLLDLILDEITYIPSEGLVKLKVSMI